MLGKATHLNRIFKLLVRLGLLRLLHTARREVLGREILQQSEQRQPCPQGTDHLPRASIQVSQNSGSRLRGKGTAAGKKEVRGKRAVSNRAGQREGPRPRKDRQWLQNMVLESRALEPQGGVWLPTPLTADNHSVPQPSLLQGE